MNITRKSGICIGACALVLLTIAGPRSGVAQGSRNAPPCDVVARILIEGVPGTRLGWASENIPRCRAEGGVALAAALRAHAGSSDVAVLDTITRAAGRLRDGTLLEAAFEVASSPSASPEARVFAIRTLLYGALPAFRFTFAELTDPENDNYCSGESISLHEPSSGTGTRFAEGFDQRVRDLASRLSQDGTAPMLVRRAAVCARGIRAMPWQDRQPGEDYEILVVPKRRP
jgi:hypothetical protein